MGTIGEGPGETQERLQTMITSPGYIPSGPLRGQLDAVMVSLHVTAWASPGRAARFLVSEWASARLLPTGKSLLRGAGTRISGATEGLKASN